jgi:hypothetical protein
LAFEPPIRAATSRQAAATKAVVVDRQEGNRRRIE